MTNFLSYQFHRYISRYVTFYFPWLDEIGKEKPLIGIDPSELNAVIAEIHREVSDAQTFISDQMSTNKVTIDGIDEQLKEI